MPLTTNNMEAQSSNSISKASYDSIHQWMRRQFGGANRCEHNCGTTSTKFDWALVRGKRYEKKRENFIMLCKKCHHAYDKIARYGEDHPMYGKHHTTETKKKMSNSSKHLSPNLGKKASQETREKMSKVRKGVPKTEEHKRKISAANRGIPKTEEHKRKISEAKRSGLSTTDVR